MEENMNPQSDQSQEALDKANKFRRLQEQRAAYYAEQTRKLEEEQHRAKEAKQKAEQEKRRMMAMVRWSKMKQAG